MHVPLSFATSFQHHWCSDHWVGLGYVKRSPNPGVPSGCFWRRFYLSYLSPCLSWLNNWLIGNHGVPFSWDVVNSCMPWMEGQGNVVHGRNRTPHAWDVTEQMFANFLFRDFQFSTWIAAAEMRIFTFWTCHNLCRRHSVMTTANANCKISQISLGLKKWVLKTIANWAVSVLFFFFQKQKPT